MEIAELGLDMPRHLRRALTQIERGELGARVELKDIDWIMANLQRMVDRLAMSILVSALILGLTLFVHMFAPEDIGGYASWFFSLSFAGAVILGLWELFSIVRSRRG